MLGAVDPYRQLLGGKLAALCTVSDEVIAHLEAKYAGATTVILGQVKPSRPVLITTTLRSAAPRSTTGSASAACWSSAPVGYTEGFGHFQFSDALFRDLASHVAVPGEDRKNEYGRGPNWRIRVLRTALEQVGLPGDLLRHGIRRQVYLAPVARNWAEFLRGQTDTIEPTSRPLEGLASYFRERWAIPRATRRPQYRDWNPEDMRLTPELPGAPLVYRLF